MLFNLFFLKSLCGDARRLSLRIIRIKLSWQLATKNGRSMAMEII
jgi:hypothetical protein